MGMFDMFKGRPTVQHPVAVERVRMDPVRPGAHFPVGSIRDTPVTTVELAPRTVTDETENYAIGKRPVEFIRPVTSLAIAEWQGVMQWPAGNPRVLVPLRVPMAPFQGQVPFAERVNVDMPAQVSLGATTSIKGTTWTAPNYGKIGVLS